MKILITSGGTREYIDGVRVLTNISSGALGARIATTFQEKWPFNGKLEDYDLDLYFVYVKGSKKPEYDNVRLYEVTDVQSVYETIEKLVPEMDVVIHPMAVSDFGFRPIHTKLKSNDPEAFIESLRERIYQTPKILAHIKEWNPKCYLVSFKFEDGVTNEELIQIATDSMVKNHCDLVFANEKSEMVKSKEHIAYAIDGKGVKRIESKGEIAMEIVNRVITLR